MRIVVIVLALVLVFAGATAYYFFTSGPEPAPSPINQIPMTEQVVVVGDYGVSGAWLRNWCVTQYLQIERTNSPGMVRIDEYDMIRAGRELLTKVVAVAVEAERRGLVVSDELLETKLREEISRFDSTEQWLAALSSSGLDRESRKRDLRLELLFQLYESEIVGPAVRERIGREQLVRTYYDKFRDELFVNKRRVHVLHITRSVGRDAPAGEREAERQILIKARGRIEAGESFESVAKELSTVPSALEGGEMGWVQEDSPVQPEILEVMLALKEGELSDIIENPLGFHLFTAAEVESAGVRSFEDAEEEITERLYRQALKDEMGRRADEIVEGLRAAEKIKVLNLTPFLGKALTPRERAASETAPATGPATAPAPAPATAP